MTRVNTVIIVKRITMLWACNVKRGDAHNRKHAKCEDDGNRTQKKSKDEMA